MKNLAADREAVNKQREKLRADHDELQDKLETVKQHRARLLAQYSGLELEVAEVRAERAKLRARVQELADERSNLVDERDRLLAKMRALETEHNQLLADVEGDQNRLQQLGEDGVASLKQMIDELSEQRNRLEQELNQTKTSLVEVEGKLERAQRDVVAASDAQDKYHPDNPELLMGLVQELRTPMTSITGYVDLLMGESAGILGEMQRKFLQRVSANISRLASMLDDLIHVTELDTGQFELEPEPVDVVELIEDAITNAATQLREKGLTVHLNLEEDIPPIKADRDALGQIIGQLLTNAYLVSPPDTEIFIMAQRRQVNLAQGGDEDAISDSLFASVEDRGGGIAPEDEARVFVRKYKAENPLIQGLGDTGVGLSIAKALVEAHNGRLWLETREGIGSIFCFALPLDLSPEPEG